MKLDRNKNTDGRGKYALIQMRELSFAKSAQIYNNAGDPKEDITIPANAIRSGAESPGDQFFVLKYKDKFAADALFAYANSVLSHARSLPTGDEQDSLMEYGGEMIDEANLALRAGNKIPT